MRGDGMRIRETAMTVGGDDERQVIEQCAGAERIALIADSFCRLTGRSLVSAEEGHAKWGDIADALWHLPAVVLAHGVEDDPIFFYANRAGLDRFDLAADALIALPSRYSAEPLERSERARLLERVGTDGYIDDYAGVRIAASGARFRIEQATVWNLADEHGAIHGQAATFSRWTDL